MKVSTFVLLAALLGTSGIASAEYSGTREDRMQSALDNYRQTHGGGARNAKAGAKSGSAMNARYADPRNPAPGPAARAESSIKRGASDAGDTIRRGASKTASAVRSGTHKTHMAIDRAGQKIKGKTAE